MFTRRQFVATGAGALVASTLPRLARADVKNFQYAEFERALRARISGE